MVHGHGRQWTLGMAPWVQMLLFLLLVSVTTPMLEAQSGEPLLLGAIAAQTGDAAVSNTTLFEVLRYNVERINRAGGLLGRPLLLREYDNAGTSLGSRAAALQAVDDGVFAVIGAVWSDHSLAMAPVLQAAGIPMITPISTHPRVTQLGDYIFRVCFTDDFQGRALARYAYRNLGLRSVAVLMNASSTYSVDLAGVFSREFTSLGGRILLSREYLLEQADFRDMVSEAQRLNPSAVFIPGDYRDSSFIIGAIRDLGWNPVILGGDAFGARLFDYIGDRANGVYYSTHWHRDSDNPLSRAFVQNYEAHTGQAIRQTTTALTHDAFQLLVDAVNRAGTVQGRELRGALAATESFEGISGTIRFDSQGDPLKTITINQLEGGQVRYLQSVSP